MQTQMAAQVTHVTQLIAGLSGSFKGIEAPRGRAPGRSGENKCSSVESIGTQPPVCETLGTVRGSLLSMEDKKVTDGINVMWVWKPRSDINPKSD